MSCGGPSDLLKVRQPAGSGAIIPHPWVRPIQVQCDQDSATLQAPPSCVLGRRMWWERDRRRGTPPSGLLTRVLRVMGGLAGARGSPEMRLREMSEHSSEVAGA